MWLLPAMHKIRKQYPIRFHGPLGTASQKLSNMIDYAGSDQHKLHIHVLNKLADHCQPVSEQLHSWSDIRHLSDLSEIVIIHTAYIGTKSSRLYP